MPHFKVTRTRTVTINEIAWIEIAAPNLVEAKRLAENTPDADFDYGDAEDDRVISNQREYVDPIEDPVQHEEDDNAHL